MKAKWKVFQCVQNNGLNYWIVADKAFKGTVLAHCNSEEKARSLADYFNGN